MKKDTVLYAYCTGTMQSVAEFVLVKSKKNNRLPLSCSPAIDMVVSCLL